MAAPAQHAPTIALRESWSSAPGNVRDSARFRLGRRVLFQGGALGVHGARARPISPGWLLETGRGPPRGSDRRERLYFRAHFDRGLVAPFRRPVQGAEDDLIQAHVDLDLPGGRLELLRRQLTGEHLVKHHTQRVDIGAMIRAPMFHLLRRHVSRRAGGLRLGQTDARIVTQDLRYAKVSYLDAAMLIEQQVFGLDVAMYDAVFVRKLQCLTHGRHYGERLLRGELASLHGLAKIHAIDKLHHKEIEAFRAAGVMNGDNVWVIQLRQRFRLASEPLRKSGLVADVGGRILSATTRSSSFCRAL